MTVNRVLRGESNIGLASPPTTQNMANKHALCNTNMVPDIIRHVTHICDCSLCVTRRKQHRPGIAPNANTTHVPTAGSSAAPTKLNHTPSRHSRAKGKLLLQMVTPHAAGSRRTHVSRTQECARTHPVTRRATTQYLHTQHTVHCVSWPNRHAGRP